MKALLITIIAALALAVPAQAAPPQVPEDPATHFLVTRVLSNGNEIALETFAVTEWFEAEQVVRQTLFEWVKVQTVNNPAWRVVVYGPVDFGGYWTVDDRVWDSLFNF